MWHIEIGEKHVKYATDSLAKDESRTENNHLCFGPQIEALAIHPKTCDHPPYKPGNCEAWCVVDAHADGDTRWHVHQPLAVALAITIPNQRQDGEHETKD